MTDKQFDSIMDQLFKLTELVQQSLGNRPQRPNEWQRGDSDQVNVPQPTWLLADPAEVVIHWSKNKDKKLGELSQASLSYYAAKWSPRVSDNTGQMWPDDERLLNAARQLWHTQQRTLDPNLTLNSPTHAKKPENDVPF